MKAVAPYVKREYKEVAGSFKHAAKSPYCTLFGLLPLSRKVVMGINGKGIWLWHIDPVKPLSRRMIPRNTPIGFFEWDWICDIHVSYSLRIAYISFHDTDTLLKQVVLAKPLEDFEKQFITNFGDQPVLQFPLSNERCFSILDHVTNRGYVPVYPLE